MNHLVFGNIVKETCRRLNSADAKCVINGEVLHYGSAEIYMSVDMNHSNPELITQVLLDASKSELSFNSLIAMLKKNLSIKNQRVEFIHSDERTRVIALGFRKKIDDVNCKTLSENLRTISNLQPS